MTWSAAGHDMILKARLFRRSHAHKRGRYSFAAALRNYDWAARAALRQRAANRTLSRLWWRAGASRLALRVEGDGDDEFRARLRAAHVKSGTHLLQ